VFRRGVGELELGLGTSGEEGLGWGERGEEEGEGDYAPPRAATQRGGGGGRGESDGWKKKKKKAPRTCSLIGLAINSMDSFYLFFYRRWAMVSPSLFFIYSFDSPI
jgi:hypothetical protein